MKDRNNYYEALRVKASATKEEIKKAYHKVSKEVHPDKGGNPDHQALVNAAYYTLFDEDRRERYDNGFDDLPPAEQEAVGLAIQVFMGAISADPHLDVLKKAIDGLRQSKRTGQDAIKKDEKAIKSYRDTTQRLRHRKTATTSLIHHAIETESAKLEQSIRRSEHAMKIHDRAIELLQEYEYKPKEYEEGKRGRLDLYFNITNNSGTGAW